MFRRITAVEAAPTKTPSPPSTPLRYGDYSARANIADGGRLCVVVAAISIALLFTAPTARADDPPGAKPYATYCAACHGAGGKGGFASQLGSEAYLQARDDAAIVQSISEGMPGKGMPAWSKSKGGALSDAQIADIVAYLRAFAPTVGAPVAAVPNAPVAPPANAPTSNFAFIQTQLSVTQAENAAGELVVSARLQEYTGYPVSGATIAFSRATTFGVVDLGTAKTGANGIATLILPEAPANARQVDVTFKGDKRLDASAAKIALEPRVDVASGSFDANTVRLSVEEPLLPPEGSLITPNPPLLPTVLFALVVGCIWATYGLVISQMVGIWKHGRGQAWEDVLRKKR